MATALRGRATEADVRLGRMVKAIADLVGMEQKQLAALAGMSPQALNGKIKGRSPWSLGEMDAVADALGVSRQTLQRDPDELLAAWSVASTPTDGMPANLSTRSQRPLVRAA